jgi:hypothetical protein
MRTPLTALLRTSIAAAALALALALVSGCGGGGNGGSAGGSGGNPGGPGNGVTPPPAVAAPQRTEITLQSDAGDSIGLGRSYSYSPGNSSIAIGESLGRLTITVDGDEHWTADFIGPNAESPLRVGSYANLSALPPADPQAGAFRWFGEGRGCATSIATVTIDQVAYNAGLLESIILRFERRCDGATAALRGEVRWNKADLTQPAGIVSPPPAGLWTPPAALIPTAENYVVLVSEPGDAVGLGQTHVYRDTDALMHVTGLQGVGPARVTVYGEQQWSGNFQAPDFQQALVPGYYPNLRGTPFYNPVRGGMAWVGDGRGCNGLDGWFVVDRVVYQSGWISGLDVRFEQRCDGASAVLRGALHWDAPQTGLPEAILVPAGSWSAPQSALPVDGNYLYLESAPGDAVGGGVVKTTTPLNSTLSVDATLGTLSVQSNGATRWLGGFQMPPGTNTLQVGVYENLARLGLPNPNPVGAFGWSADSRGCIGARGWVAIDSVVYAAGELQSIDMRFEHACEASSGSLKGQLHWSANDSRVPPGPVAIPPQVWKPQPSAVPAAGNYVYLQGHRGDPVGMGTTATYTQADAVIEIKTNGAGLDINVLGDERWTLLVQPMAGQTRIEPGYYPGLRQPSLRNAARGGVAFYGEGRACNTPLGSVAVDGATYAGTALVALDLRFEQHCEGFAASAMRGSIHWRSDDPTTPPGPVNPPPTSLWQPPAGATPANGSYVYLQSDPGDYIGGGQTLLYSAPTTSVKVSEINGGGIQIIVGDDALQGHEGTFVPMISLTRLEPGYYGQLQRWPFGNPARGSMDWTSMLRGCNTLDGWFVVDDIVYSSGALSKLELRFEQHCDGAVEALRGRIRWER